MTINQTCRLMATAVAAALILLTGHLTVASGLPEPPQDPEPSSKVQQLQRELNDLKQSYAKLQAERGNRTVSGTPRFPRATSPAAPLNPPRAATTLWRGQGGPAPQLADPFASRATTVYGTRAPIAGIYRFDSEAEQRVSKLVAKIRETEEDSEKGKLKDELKTELSKQYDKYLENIEKPLVEMEKRLDALREQFENRKSLREEMIKHRLDALWYEANGMSWPGTNKRFGVPYFPGVPGGPDALTTRPVAVGTSWSPEPGAVPPEPGEEPKTTGR